MFDIQSYQKAESVSDAIRLLGEDPEARLIAGGTDVLVQMREGRRVAFGGSSKLHSPIPVGGLPSRDDLGSQSGN